VFSPSALNPDGTGNIVTGTLTVNTNGASTLVARSSSPTAPGLLHAAVLYLPGELAVLVIPFTRRRRAKNVHSWRWFVLFVLLAGCAGLTACGGSSSMTNSQYAAPGSYTVSLTAADSAGGPSQSINFTVDVQ
jgi:drug/metabolite transporter (DMT)-like permease